MKKYEFTGACKHWDDNIVLWRIRALRSFGRVKAGQLGGWIEKEENLSHNGNAWVADEAMVMGNSHILDHACVKENATVQDNALVTGHAIILGDAIVSEFGYVSDYAMVAENAKVFGTASIKDHALVCGDCVVGDNAFVCGDFILSGDAYLCGNARVYNAQHYLTIGPIGSRDDFITFFRAVPVNSPEIFVKCGSFCGSLEQFEKEVEKKHGCDGYREEYRCAIELAEFRINLF